MADLKAKIRNALAGSSSQQPVDTATLYKLGTRKQIEAELLAMYRASEVCCCKIIGTGGENIVWWLSGKVVQPLSYGRTGRVEIVITPRARCGPAMSDLTRSVLQKVKTSPGISRASLLAFGCAQQTIKNPQQVKSILGNLGQRGLIIGSGKRHILTYTPGEAK